MKSHLSVLLVLPVLALLGGASLCHAQTDVMALLKAGEANARAGQFNAAIEDYSRAIAAAPGYWAAYVRRAAAKSLKEDWKGALEDLDKAISLKADRAEVFGARAFAHLHLGNHDAARADFATVERLDPVNGRNIMMRFAQELITRARTKSQEGNNAGAIKDLDMIIALAPELGVAYHERGAAKGALRQFKEAVADLDLAIKFDTWHNAQGDSHRLRAAARRVLGDTAGADADDAEAAKRRGEGSASTPAPAPAPPPQAPPP
ncbi:MAG: tetratricopeptide repeat protein [Prosthecobacter sp.]